MCTSYQYVFDELADLDALEDTLLMSILAAEGLHGSSRIRLDVTYHLDRPGRTFAIDASSDAGRDVCRIFTSLVARQLGDASFGVKRITSEVVTA